MRINEKNAVHNHEKRIRFPNKTNNYTEKYDKYKKCKRSSTLQVKKTDVSCKYNSNNTLTLSERKPT